MDETKEELDLEEEKEEERNPEFSYAPSLESDEDALYPEPVEDALYPEPVEDEVYPGPVEDELHPGPVEDDLSFADYSDEDEPYVIYPDEDYDSDYSDHDVERAHRALRRQQEIENRNIPNDDDVRGIIQAQQRATRALRRNITRASVPDDREGGLKKSKKSRRRKSKKSRRTKGTKRTKKSRRTRRIKK